MIFFCWKRPGIYPQGPPSVFEEGPKTVRKAVLGRPQTMEQSTDRRPIDAPLIGVVNGKFSCGNEERLFNYLKPPTFASIAHQLGDASSRAIVNVRCFST